MTYVRDPATTSELLKRDDVDAIEIHTSGRYASVNFLCKVGPVISRIWSKSCISGVSFR